LLQTLPGLVNGDTETALSDPVPGPASAVRLKISSGSDLAE